MIFGRSILFSPRCTNVPGGSPFFLDRRGGLGLDGLLFFVTTTSRNRMKGIPRVLDIPVKTMRGVPGQLWKTLVTIPQSGSVVY